MADPRSYGAYLAAEVRSRSYGWDDDETASPSWLQEHVDAEGRLGIRATLSATLRRFCSRESLVVQVHHRRVTACSRRRTCYILQMLQPRGSWAIRA